MARSFSHQIAFNKQTVLAVVVPQLRQDGMYYEVNIGGQPRFYMAWSPLGRYDITDEETNVPYELVLSVADLLEKETKKR